ncbi:NDP-sugar synthase [Dictyobacter kobayashii]|nr:NDP-sugar synthase [Dictyobacter kobayashii]
MLSLHMPVLCYKTSSYWTDIGTPQALFTANMDALQGHVRVSFPESVQNKNTRIEPGCSIAKDADLHGPLLIGESSVICQGASLIGPVVIGANCLIGRNTYISHTVLLPGTVIPDNAIISGGLIGKNHITEEDKFTAKGEYQCQNV